MGRREFKSLGTMRLETWKREDVHVEIMGAWVKSYELLSYSYHLPACANQQSQCTNSACAWLPFAMVLNLIYSGRCIGLKTKGTLSHCSRALRAEEYFRQTSMWPAVQKAFGMLNRTAALEVVARKSVLHIDNETKRVGSDLVTAACTSEEGLKNVHLEPKSENVSERT